MIGSAVFAFFSLQFSFPMGSSDASYAWLGGVGPWKMGHGVRWGGRRKKKYFASFLCGCNEKKLRVGNGMSWLSLLTYIYFLRIFSSTLRRLVLVSLFQITSLRLCLHLRFAFAFAFFLRFSLTVSVFFPYR